MLTEYRAVALIGHLTFGSLLLLAWTLAYERMLYMDSAYYLFNLLQQGKLFYEEGQRYAGALTRILPVLLRGSGAPLSAVLLAYSINFILVYYGVWLLALRVAGPGQRVLSLSVPLLLLAGLREGFYQPVAEPHQGMVWAALLGVWLLGARRTWPSLKPGLHVGGAVLLIALCFLSHPVTVFVVGFVVAFAQQLRGRLLTAPTAGLLAAALVPYLLKAWLTPAESYEGDQFGQLARFGSSLARLPQLYSFEFFWRKSCWVHLPGLLVLAGLCFFYIRQREFGRLALVLGATLVFWLVTVVVYHRGDSDIMMEKNFLPLSAFAFMALLYEWPRLPRPDWLLAGIGVLLGGCLLGIFLRSDPYSKRVELLSRALADCRTQQVSKAVLVRNPPLADRVMVPWALSVETLLLSSVEGPANTQTLFWQEDAKTARELARTTRPDQLLFTPFWLIYNAADLNPHYFGLPATRYAVIDYSRGLNEPPLFYFPPPETASP